jgi:MscS family membrane protein
MNLLLASLPIYYYFQGLIRFFQQQLWLLYGLIAIMFAIVLTYGLYTLKQQARRRWFKKEYALLKILTKALYWPLVIFIWIEFLAINAKLMIDHLAILMPTAMSKLHNVSLLFLLAWTFIRLIRLFEKELLRGNFKSGTTDRTTIQALGKGLRVGAFIIIALLLLPILGIQITALIAFASGSAIVVGIAAQQVIGNYFGGIVVHSDGHFKVGDWIYSPDKQLEGIVEYIGWRSTHIRTLDCRMLYVPNSILSSIIIVNSSRMTHRRIKEIIHIRYEDSATVEKILTEINTMLQDHPALDKTKRLAIHFSSFGPFSIQLTLYAFTTIVDWRPYVALQQSIFLDIINIITKQGAKITIPPNSSTIT